MSLPPRQIVRERKKYILVLLIPQYSRNPLVVSNLAIFSTVYSHALESCFQKQIILRDWAVIARRSCRKASAAFRRSAKSEVTQYTGKLRPHKRRGSCRCGNKICLIRDLSVGLTVSAAIDNHSRFLHEYIL